ncbi:uncharacterized protein LOC108606028 [Drosophila busckii]|uniref:uncharacterized protein LOC108606028 n=1 Tax=Drosophila busckii TaxID=30019 RepID=UPI00083F48D8|nr:uncharacterized protein LOC108606028 [Drosophila busckii]
MESFGNNNPYQLLFIDDDELKQLRATQKKLRNKLAVDKPKAPPLIKKLPMPAKLAKRNELVDAELEQQLELMPPPYLELRAERNFRKRNVNKGERELRGKLDRRSGSDKTGIKAIDKRNGGGAHNWGSALKDIEATAALSDADASICEQQQQQQQQVTQLQAEQQLWDNSDEEQAELEAKYITVEEWRAKSVARAKPIFNIRKPGEGEAVKPDWQQMTVLQQKKKKQQQQQQQQQESQSNYNLLTEPQLEYDAALLYPQRVGRLQRIVDIEFKFKDDHRRRGWQSGWQRRQRNQTGNEAAADGINMNDELEFPNLH